MENQIIRRTRSGKLLGSAVTKKTIRETVEVVVTPYDSSAKEVNRSTGVELDVISTSTNENQKVEVISTTPWKSAVRRVTIDFGKQSDEDQVMQLPAPVAVEGKDVEEDERRKELQWRKEEHDNEIETQQTREYIQDLEKQKQQELPEQERGGGEVQPEKNTMNMEDNEDETQPASEEEVPPPEEDEENEEEWFDVEDEEPKEPFPPEPEPKKAKQAKKGTDREVTTPPRYEAPQKRDDEETVTKKKRKAPSGAKKGTENLKASSSAKKSSGKDSSNGKKKRKKSRRSSGDIAADYRTYIYRVLKQVHPDLGISSKGMATINSFLNEMYENIGDEAARLSRYTDAKTLSARDIQDAVKMVLPGDLGKHAIAEGAKAISRYVTY